MQFLKSKADLEYMDKRLRLDFMTSAENILHAEGVKTVGPCPLLNTTKYKDSLKNQTLTPKNEKKNMCIKSMEHGHLLISNWLIIIGFYASLKCTLFCIFKDSNSIPFIYLFIWMQSWTNIKPTCPVFFFVLNHPPPPSSQTLWMDERTTAFY